MMSMRYGIALAAALLAAHEAVALAPWVTDEEREFVKKRVSRIETIPGTPEDDAKRFYKVGVQLMKRNYGETLAGQRLALAHRYCAAVWKYMDDPRSQPFDQHLLLACALVRPPFGYVRRTECHGLSPYDWKWTMDFADRVFGRVIVKKEVAI